MDKVLEDKEHNKIYEKLDTFIESGKIPHLIFFGNHGSGKRTFLNYLINKIYSDIENKNEYMIHINCCQFKGIKYIREDLKFFGKKQIHNHKCKVFKSIILFNAEFLTIDAQSSLRRLIEIYSNTTRFFMITNNKNKIIRPILSRFCLVYVPSYSNIGNLHIYTNRIINTKSYKTNDYKIMKDVIDNIKTMTHKDLFYKAKELYENCIDVDSLMSYFNKKIILKENTIKGLTLFNSFEFKLKYIMKEIKDDILILYIILMFFRFNSDFVI